MKFFIKKKSQFYFIITLLSVTSLETLKPNAALIENIELKAKPIDLVSPWRIDVMAKYIYAKHRELGVKSDWADRLYASHLKVWNNFSESANNAFEPFAGKQGLNDFTHAFHGILDSIKVNGFDRKKSCIFVDTRKLPINGSHRIAACLLYDKDITYKYDSRFQAIESTAEFFKTYRLFVKDGLDEKYIDAMVLQHCALKRDTYVVTIFPVAVGKNEEIKALLKKYGTIVYEKKISLTKNGAFNFVKMIYDGEAWTGDWSNNFAGVTGAMKARFPQGYGDIRVFIFSCENLEKVRKCKQSMRDLFKIENPSVHINDTHAETLILAQGVLNKNSIHHLNYAVAKRFEKFEKFFGQYKDWLKRAAVDQECFCVDSSAILSVYGMRDCADLDFLHHGYDEVALHTGNSYVSSHNSSLHHHVTPLDDIVFNPENYFYYKGVKFASLDVVKNMKKKRFEKPKDVADLALIHKHLESLEKLK